MTEVTTVTSMSNVDDLVRRYRNAKEKAEEWAEETARILDLLRELPVGEHETAEGHRIKVAPPARSFDLDKALTLLPAELTDAAKVTTYDPKIIKSLLPPVLLDQAMKPGTGKLRVLIS